MSSDTFKLKLKLTAPLVPRSSNGDDSDYESTANSSVAIARVDLDTSKPLLIGARGGAALKELLSTAPNPEEAIRAFQSAHGLQFATTTTTTMTSSSQRKKKTSATTTTRFTAAEKLLDLLHVGRSSVYESLLDKLLNEMLLRIEELSQEELQRMLEATFPYIEFRELRKIPIAILARQDETPETYLRELTENRRILSELPVHVRRKILHVDKQELHYFVEQCTQEYIEEKLAWYLKHSSLTPSAPSSTATSTSTARKNSESSFLGRHASLNGSSDLWNVSSHMPSPSARTSSSTNSHTPWSIAPEERRRQSAALLTLSEMIGDSESLYLATLEILKEYVATASIPGSSNTDAKDYVDYVPFLGALRCDLANLQRDKTTSQLRTDPLHKFIWFLDRAVKNHHQSQTHSHSHGHNQQHHSMDITQLHELLTVVKKLRTGDVPLNKKFNKKKSEIQEEEDHFEIVLGPPPVDQLLIVLDKIAKIDVRMIFAEPVPDDVPNYRTIIKEPMDLSTMRKKAKKGKYKTLETFTDDFTLMIKNCTTFNPDTTVFYKEGKRVGKRGLEIIERNAITLRGEPQRIRAKKRKKSGPAEAMTMLTSSGVVTLKDFGDVDQTGMVPEGICDETLADVAMLLSDPHVKQMLCDSLLKTLVVCWHRRELPTDNLVCRGLVQLLQIGNPASVRRMLRKRDFVLRAPQVVTMRVVLPLLIRSIATYRIGFPSSSVTHHHPHHREPKPLKDDLSDSALWENMLRASSAIRSVTRAFVLQALKDHHAEPAAHLLELLVLVEDDILFRDRVFLHTLGEIVLLDVKTASHVPSSSAAVVDIESSGSFELHNSMVWKTLVDGFFVTQLQKQTTQNPTARHQPSGSIVQYYEGDDTGDEAAKSEVEGNGGAVDSAAATTSNGSGPAKRGRVVKTFPVPIFHEKVAMVLASAVQILDKNANGGVDMRVVATTYLRRTLGATRRACSSLEEFETLWQSQPFQQCRIFYEQLLARCPELRETIFSVVYTEENTDEKATAKTEKPDDATDDEEREAGEVDEDVAMDG